MHKGSERDAFDPDAAVAKAEFHPPQEVMKE